jgi:hypothetical protein
MLIIVQINSILFKHPQAIWFPTVPFDELVSIGRKYFDPPLHVTPVERGTPKVDAEVPLELLIHTDMMEAMIILFRLTMSF